MSIFAGKTWGQSTMVPHCCLQHLRPAGLYNVRSDSWLAWYRSTSIARISREWISRAVYRHTTALTNCIWPSAYSQNQESITQNNVYRAVIMTMLLHDIAMLFHLINVQRFPAAADPQTNWLTMSSPADCYPPHPPSLFWITEGSRWQSFSLVNQDVCMKCKLQ